MTLRKVYDHLGRQVTLPDKPARIVSLVPSITETLFALGLRGSVVGRTRFCIFPEEVGKLPAVGGTKDASVEKILSLSPDLLIAEKEETPKELVEQLHDKLPVYVTHVESFDDGLRLIRDLGEIAKAEEKAEELLSNLQKAFDRFRMERDMLLRQGMEKGAWGEEGPAVTYLIWRKPYMVAGSTTFIDAMLHQLGVRNLFAGRGRYPVVTEAELSREEMNLLFLSSEPFPFSQRYEAEFRNLSPGAKIFYVDGSIFSWYGARMLSAPKYFKKLLREIIGTL